MERGTKDKKRQKGQISLHAGHTALQSSGNHTNHSTSSQQQQLWSIQTNKASTLMFLPTDGQSKKLKQAGCKDGWVR